MQAVLLITVFVLFMAVVNGFIAAGGSSAPQLRQLRIEETQDLFKNIEKVVHNDLTLTYWHANRNGVEDVAEYLRASPSLRRLASGRYADPALDPWGQPIRGKIITENRVIYADAANNLRILAPVTGLVLMSDGPDRVGETNLTSITTIAALPGAVAVSGSDDIVYAFTDEQAQQAQLARLQALVDRIAAAELQNYQLRLSDYRRQRVESYKAGVASGSSTITLSQMMSDGADAPTYLSLADKDARVTLGVDQEIYQLERTLPLPPVNGVEGAGGGNLQLLSTVSGTTLTIQLRNNPAASTPWASGNAATPVLYQLTVKGG